MPSSPRQAELPALRLDLRHLAIFAMLGAVQFASKLAFEVLPNVHMVAMLTMVYTLVYRRYALFPLFTFIIIAGLYYGFPQWWISYLYTWPLLWGVTMLLPRSTPRFLRRVLPQKAGRVLRPLLYCTVCGLHGLCYGTLYAPFWALVAGLNAQQTLAWIVAGLPFDLVHGISNFAMGLLIVPLRTLLLRLEHGLE